MSLRREKSQAYRIVAVPGRVSEEVRRTKRAPGYGHPAHADLAQGYGPCRACLRPFEDGKDRRLLFTYDPFHEIADFPLPGPVYIHERPCLAEAPHDVVPWELRFIPFTLNAYGSERTLQSVRRIAPFGPVEAEIQALLARRDVDYIHIRNTEAGCYICRVER